MKKTDPARELVTICEKLQAPADEVGDVYVAKKMNVEPWSREFYLILFCISERIQFLSGIISDLDLDEDYKQEAIAHVTSIQSAFNRRSMSSKWSGTGSQHLAAQHVQPLKMLSPQVRQKISYPELSDEERVELLDMVDELKNWLANQQLSDRDFIRQAIIEGLEQLHFRLKRLEWVGWGYTLDSLREVINAYFALSYDLPEQDVEPIAHASLKKIRGFVQAFYEKANLARDAYETGGFMLKAYGAIALVGYQPVQLAGFLTAQ